jgi:hypothetical protein
MLRSQRLGGALQGMERLHQPLVDGGVAHLEGKRLEAGPHLGQMLLQRLELRLHLFQHGLLG